MGYGLTWKEVYVLSYGGLRGAVGIAFSLIVAHDTIYSEKLRNIVINFTILIMFLFNSITHHLLIDIF